MCDLRNPPLYAEDIKTKEKLQVNFCGTINPDQAKTIAQPGFYYVAATGAAYYLYDGKDWWCNRDDWGPPSVQYWLPDGVPKIFNKYRFIFVGS